MRKKRRDPNWDAKVFLGKIMAIFHASQKEKPIYRVKIERATYCPNVLTCKVSFSPTGDEYYHKACADPNHFGTSETLLRSSDNQIRNLPDIVERMGYFETADFPEDIMEQTSWLMKAIRMREYRAVETETGLEIIWVTPTDCEKKEA